jgi:cell division initiation protein
MTLTAREIQEKRFHDAFRGYSHEEVDSFIDEVTEAFEGIASERQAAQKKAQELEEQLREQANKTSGPEDMLKRLLVTAQETADKAVQSARAKAQGIIEESEGRARLIREQAEAASSKKLKEAERKAQDAVTSAATEEREIRSRIEGMKKFEHDFRTRLGAFIRSQLELLEKKPNSLAGGLGDPMPAETPAIGGVVRPHPLPPTPEARSVPPPEASNSRPEPAAVPTPPTPPKVTEEVEEPRRKLAAVAPQAVPQTRAAERAPAAQPPAAKEPEASTKKAPAEPAPASADAAFLESTPDEAAALERALPREERKDDPRSIRELFWGED